MCDFRTVYRKYPVLDATTTMWYLSYPLMTALAARRRGSGARRRGVADLLGPYKVSGGEILWCRMPVD